MNELTVTIIDKGWAYYATLTGAHVPSSGLIIATASKVLTGLDPALFDQFVSLLLAITEKVASIQFKGEPFKIHFIAPEVH